MKHRWFSFIAASVGACVLFAAERAEACTGPSGYTCGDVGVVAAPANANLIVFRSAYAGTLTQKLVRGAAAPTLRLSSGGADVPFDVTADPNMPGYWLVKPRTPVQAGEKYTLSWDAVCTPAEIAASVAADKDKAGGGSQEVTIPAASTPIASLGALTAQAAKAKHECSCYVGAKDPAAELLPRLAEAVATELRAYDGRSVTKLTVDGTVVDDAPWAAQLASCNGGVLASCVSGGTVGVAPGRHRVGFRVAIAGLAAPLSADVEIGTDEACATPDGGTPASAPSTADGGATGAPSAAGPSTASGGGCTSSPAGLAGGTLAPFAALAAFAALRRRGRRAG